MGAGATKGTHFEKELNHPRFGKAKIVTVQGQQLLQTSIAVDQKQYVKWKQTLSAYQSNPSYLLLPISHSFQKAGFCGNAGFATINYPNHSYLLSEEIENRQSKNTKFQQPQLWLLLHSLLQARQQARAHGQQLGDVRPRNIFLNEQGSIRVANSLSWPLEQPNVQKAMDNTPTYIAPEDLARISRAELFASSSPVSQAFSIGLSALSAINLQEYQQKLYDLKNFSLRQDVFEQATSVMAFNQNYSQVLRGTILALVNLDPNRRLPSDDLAVMLQKHDAKILSKQNFVIDNAPPILHQEIINLRQQTNIKPVSVPVGVPASAYGLPSSYGGTLQNGLPALFGQPISSSPVATTVPYVPGVYKGEEGSPQTVRSSKLPESAQNNKPALKLQPLNFEQQSSGKPSAGQSQ